MHRRNGHAQTQLINCLPVLANKVESHTLLVQAGARYAEGLLKALGIPQAIVVGHSAGALTAMELFKRYVLLLIFACGGKVHSAGCLAQSLFA